MIDFSTPANLPSLPNPAPGTTATVDKAKLAWFFLLGSSHNILVDVAKLTPPDIFAIPADIATTGTVTGASTTITEAVPATIK